MSAASVADATGPGPKREFASFDRRSRDGFDVVLAGARTAEEWALEAVYRAFQKPVHAYLRAQVAAEADDLTSEVFVAVAERIRYFTGSEVAFRSWIFAIAYRRLADHRRWRARHPSEPLASTSSAGGRGDAEADALTALARDAALRRIAALPHAQAQVVLLRVVGDMSVDEVAAIVGRRAGAVRALQFRALRRLARELEAEGAADA